MADFLYMRMKYSPTSSLVIIWLFCLPQVGLMPSERASTYQSTDPLDDGKPVFERQKTHYPVG